MGSKYIVGQLSPQLIAGTVVDIYRVQCVHALSGARRELHAHHVVLVERAACGAAAPLGRAPAGIRVARE